MSTPSSAGTTLKNANQWLTPAQMKDLQEYQQMGGTITPGILIDMRKGLSLKRAVEKSAGLPAIPVPMPPPQPMPPVPKSPLMIQAIQAQQHKPVSRPEFNDNGEIVGAGLCMELFFIDVEDPSSMRPRYVIKPFKLAVNRTIDPGTRTTIPAAMYETEADAQAAVTQLYRTMFRREVGSFLERLVLAGLEQGVCEQPETDLGTALQLYLKDIGE